MEEKSHECEVSGAAAADDDQDDDDDDRPTCISLFDTMENTLGKTHGHTHTTLGIGAVGTQNSIQFSFQMSFIDMRKHTFTLPRQVSKYIKTVENGEHIYTHTRLHTAIIVPPLPSMLRTLAHDTLGISIAHANMCTLCKYTHLYM